MSRQRHRKGGKTHLTEPSTEEPHGCWLRLRKGLPARWQPLSGRERERELTWFCVVDWVRVGGSCESETSQIIIIIHHVLGLICWTWLCSLG